MERWNELVAGYVLGNLTEEESQELEEILAENPQRRQEIARLRKTATMRKASPQGPHGCQSRSPMTPYTRGSEGWSDCDSLLLEPDLLKVNRLLTPPRSSTSTLFDEDAEVLMPIETAHVHSRLGGLRSLYRDVMGPLPTSPWWWILVFALIGIGIDDCRVRRSLAIAREKIVQMEQKRAAPFPQ